MKSNFSFENLFKRLPNVSIPKEFIFFGIGAVLVMLIGLIAGNMYLQEMLFFEGQEKSIQMFTEEELREYGEIYKDLSLDFQNDIGAYCQDYANRTNRAGEKIYYGIYNHEHPELNTSKIYKHNNGQNINAAEGNHISDYDDSYNDFPDLSDDWATCIDTDEFNNGVTIKYSKTERRDGGESNYQDILTVMSMLLDQKGTRDGTNEENINIKEKVPELLRRLFKMSHTFRGTTKQLYSCEKGCRVLFYFCNEEDSDYRGTGIDLTPFQINPHNEFDDYSDEDFDIKSSEGECEICGHNGKGCVVDSELCWHGEDDEEKGPHYLGRGRTEDFTDQCSKCHDENDCQHECEGCGGEELGCIHECDSECYDCFCDGHEHWNCPGHYYVCCMGHTDITVNIHIMYVDEIINTLKNGYNIDADE